MNTKRIGVYGPVGCGKSLFILRWVEPTIFMNEEDLKGDPFTNLYSTSLDDQKSNTITEHPVDDYIDETEDFFIIIANKIGWKKIYEQACDIAIEKTFLVFTWKDKAGYSTMSSKIYNKHDEVSSYSGAGFEQFRNKILSVPSNKRRKGKKQIDDEGWTRK